MTPGEILKTETSADFIEGMKARMIVSFYKYGSVAEGVPRLDLIASLMTRLRRYADTGNTEWLIDAANFAMMEFMFPKHPKAHFRPTDSDKSPGRTSFTTGVSTSVDNKGKRQRGETSLIRDFR